jgi:hypothetical protein
MWLWGIGWRASVSLAQRFSSWPGCCIDPGFGRTGKAGTVGDRSTCPRRDPGPAMTCWPSPPASNRGIVRGAHFWCILVSWRSNIVCAVVNRGATGAKEGRCDVGGASLHTGTGHAENRIFQTKPPVSKLLCRRQFHNKVPYNAPPVGWQFRDLQTRSKRLGRPVFSALAIFSMWPVGATIL